MWSLHWKNFKNYPNKHPTFPWRNNYLGLPVSRYSTIPLQWLRLTSNISNLNGEFHYWPTSKFSRASHPFHHLLIKTKDWHFVSNFSSLNFGINKISVVTYKHLSQTQTHTKQHNLNTKSTNQSMSNFKNTKTKEPLVGNSLRLL